MSTIEFDVEPIDGQDEVLTSEALDFVVALHRAFASRRAALLQLRSARRADVVAKGRLDFLDETRTIRDGEWTVAPAPRDLEDRRVEITGPTEPKMAINALNSGAKVWLADLEDANTPHWANVIGGQRVLRSAVAGDLGFVSADGKEYRLNATGPRAVIVVRPRGWHLDEAHILIDGKPAVGALVDFGLYFFHNARDLVAGGSGPYFYLPKMESHLEARLWNDIFVFAQERLGLPHGTVRATVLIETIPAAFEMDEILYELRDHASGLNAGRWDYLFSLIKYFRDAGPDFVLPDRNSVTMLAPFMRAYARLLVRTCHRRKAFAIGGMAAFIPSRRDPQINAIALGKVRADKEREAADGFDGSWVAHPDLVALCDEIFSAQFGDALNQLDSLPFSEDVTAEQLLDGRSAGGGVTEEGLRNNISVAVQYLASWLGGNGAVAIFNLMEDAATAEISRSQIWQWCKSGTQLESGETVTAALVSRLLAEEVDKLGATGVAARRIAVAQSLFAEVSLADDYADFLTVAAYPVLLDSERQRSLAEID